MILGGFALPTSAFLLWHPGLWSGADAPPLRTSLLWITAALLQIPWFVHEWESGLANHGCV